MRQTRGPAASPPLLESQGRIEVACAPPPVPEAAGPGGECPIRTNKGHRGDHGPQAPPRAFCLESSFIDYNSTLNGAPPRAGTPAGRPDLPMPIAQHH